MTATWLATGRTAIREIDMRHQGKITNWSDERGFGFITPNGGGDKVFVHIKSFTSRGRPADKAVVTYELAGRAKGKMHAEKVAFVGQRKSIPTPYGHGTGPALCAVVFLAFVCAMVLVGRLPLEIPIWYFGASAGTFLSYAIDKASAKKQRRRIPENSLHLFALLGGWPGALAAQGLLRHKSKKQPFRMVFFGTVVLNLGFLVWLISPLGSAEPRIVPGA